MANNKVIYAEPDTIIEIRICDPDLYGPNAASWKEQMHNTRMLMHLKDHRTLDIFDPAVSITRGGRELGARKDS